MKTATKSVNRDLVGEERNRRRVFNRSLETVLAQYEDTYTFNPDRIKSNKIDLFEDTFIALSKKGLKNYWLDIDSIVNHIDTNRVTTLKEVKAPEKEMLLQQQQKQVSMAAMNTITKVPITNIIHSTIVHMNEVVITPDIPVMTSMIGTLGDVKRKLQWKPEVSFMFTCWPVAYLTWDPLGPHKLRTLIDSTEKYWSVLKYYKIYALFIYTVIDFTHM